MGTVSKESSASKPAGGKAFGDARRQRIAVRTLGGVSALLMLAIVLMVNYLGFRHYRRFDWTRQQLYTLSGKSVSVLRGLEQDVDIYLFMSQAEQNFADTEELLRRYQAASPHLKVHLVDPDREPAEFEVLAQRFGLTAGILLGRQLQDGVPSDGQGPLPASRALIAATQASEREYQAAFRQFTPIDSAHVALGPQAVQSIEGSWQELQQAIRKIQKNTLCFFMIIIV